MSPEKTFLKLDDLIEQINQTSQLDINSPDVAAELRNMEYAPSCLLQPAGKRPRDFALNDGWQGIVHAVRLEERRVSLKLTYLVAGFVFGNKGQSILDISERAEVKTQSWCASFSGNIKNVPKEVRVWHICGEPEGLFEAVTLIMKATERYQELIGGKYKDKVVSNTQEVCGISFSYKPPPIHKMPNSARTIYFCDNPSEYGNRMASIRRVKSEQLSKQEFEVEFSLQKSSSCQQLSQVIPPLPIQPGVPLPSTPMTMPSPPATVPSTPHPYYSTPVVCQQPYYYQPQARYPYAMAIPMLVVPETQFSIPNVGHFGPAPVPASTRELYTYDYNNNYNNYATYNGCPITSP